MAGSEPRPQGRSGSAAPLAPLGPEQLRQVLEQVAQAQPPPSVPRAAPQPGPCAQLARPLCPLPPQVRDVGNAAGEATSAGSDSGSPRWPPGDG